MVFNPSVRADEALGPFSFFRIINILSICQFPAGFSLQMTFYNSFSHSNSWATHVDLAINGVKVVTGHDLDIHCSTLAIDASLQSSCKFVKWFGEKDLYGHGGHLGNVT